MNYRAAKTFILRKLRQELSENLYYHGYHHTLDVLRVATNLCKKEQVPNKKIPLVKTAALLHDAGFIKNKHANHEAEGCALAKSVLPNFGYSTEEIDEICGMIMATKIPQSPHNHLEEIICDADLDYLGRDDFYTIAASLYTELAAYNLMNDEKNWNRVQVSFLSQHHFFTQTNIQEREPVKQIFLEKLKALVATYQD